MIELTQINVYPVKSCRGLTLARCPLTEFGLQNDRRWMVVDAENNFLSQRSFPAMALLEPTLTTECLVLKASAGGALEVPTEIESGDTRSVKIWNDTCLAYDCGEDAAHWLTEYLKTEARLVIRGDTFRRPVDRAYAVHDEQVGFADAFPLLLTSSASLRDLNSRLDLPIPMNRFRPNLVVSGCDPFAEDAWKRISVDGVNLRVCKPCARCTVPAVDQTTGVVGKEPLTTLATYRKSTNEKVLFGQNLISEQVQGELVLGMEVHVLEPA